MSSRWRVAIDGVLKSLHGALGSNPERRLFDALPPVDRPITDSEGQLRRYNGWHVFGNDQAKIEFVKSALIVLSDNGLHNLTSLTFDTFYSRAYDDTGNMWYTASIVAMDDLSVRHTIMASSAATTKASAFRLLVMSVEETLGLLLRTTAEAGLGHRVSRISQSTVRAEDEKKDEVEMEEKEEKEESAPSIPSASEYEEFVPIMIEPMPSLGPPGAFYKTPRNKMSYNKPLMRSFTTRN